MSDPVSNAEIEDVLSSIRRLISADQRDNSEPTTPTDNKLILTPAFRVFDGDRKEVDGVDAAVKHGSGRDIPVEKLGQADLVVAEAANKADDAQDLPPFELSFDPDEVDPGMQSSAEMPVPPADSQVDFEDNWDSDALGETAQVAFLYERMNRAAADTPEEKEPEVASDEATDPVVIPEGEEAVQDSAPELTSEPDAIEDEETTSSDQDILESVGEALADDAETPSVTGDVNTADQMFEAAKDDFDAEAVVARMEVEDAPAPEIVEDDSDFVDEVYLQEIVSRIVREELKGEIGVKITQAVRRMVRREVTRALSLEKFD